MAESGWYAPGTEFDPKAPWNQEDIPEKDFDCTIELSLKKTTKVSSSSYYIDEDPEYSFIDTSDIDWTKEYTQQHYTPKQLLEMFANRLREEINVTNDLHKIHQLEFIIKECESWEEDISDIYEDK